MKRILLILFLSLQWSLIFSQTPKREFRAVWVSSVWNLDWPKTKGVGAMSTQQTELRNMLDELKAAGFNAVLLQVRPTCDALYASTYEPWSYWLTGSEGTAPNPYWDPLEFAINEAHKRGMELHAWINPYRLIASSTYNGVSSKHPLKKYPSWVLTVGSVKILNPGLTEVINYVTMIVADIVSRYDVDGIAFDDYFYPYPPNDISTEDQATFNAYPRGFSNIGDWRRNNVNMLIASVYNKIQELKPYVKFGVSPAGIWKNNNPPGITGLQAYYEIYCDAIAWINAKTVDYISPQLYWKIGGSQDYIALSNWWATKAKTTGRLFFPSKSLNSSYSTSEIPNQLTHDRSNPDIHGTIFFRAGQVVANNLNLETQLKENYYKYKSLPNALSWKNSIPPNVVRNLKITVSSGYNKLTWDEPLQASDNEIARYYVIYRSETQNFSINDNRNILDVVYGNVNFYNDYSIQSGKNYFYAVTALDNYGNESSKGSEVSPGPVFQTLWERCSRTNNKPTWFGTDTERGITYTNGKLFVVSRKDGLKVKIIDALTGNDIGELNTEGIDPSSSVPVVSYGINDIESSWDGKLLACNLTVDASKTPFKIYKWDNESSTPTLFLSYTTTNVERLGDNFTVYGSLSSNASIYAAAANSNRVYRWLVINGSLSSQTPALITLSNFTLGTTPSIAPYGFDSNSDFYANSLGKQVTLFGSDGSNKGSVSGGVIPSGSSSIKTFVKDSKRFIATFQWNNTAGDPNGQNVRVVDVTAGSTSVTEKDIYGITPRLGDDINGNGTGDFAYLADGSGNYVFFVLATNSGIGAYWCKASPLYNGGTLSNEECIDRISNVPDNYYLAQNYPNPFNPTTFIEFSLASDDQILLEVFNIIGECVETLAVGNYAAGYYKVEFNAKDLPSGVYFYRLKTTRVSLTRKMLLLK